MNTKIIENLQIKTQQQSQQQSQQVIPTSKAAEKIGEVALELIKVTPK